MIDKTRRSRTPRMIGPGWDGSPACIYVGEPAIIHVEHDDDCPTIRSQNIDDCQCRPDVWLERVGPDT